MRWWDPEKFNVVDSELGEKRGRKERGEEEGEEETRKEKKKRKKDSNKYGFSRRQQLEIIVSPQSL